MSADLSLCRFSTHGARPHLGLVSNGQLYDLTASGAAEYATFEAWLKWAGGRVSEALPRLDQIVASAAPVCAAEVLLDPEQEPRPLAPLDTQEVWACGVTYEMSREARMRESEEPTIYGRVYDAPRPEVFLKATPHRVVGPEEAVAIRGDSTWNVPEPELTLVVTPQLEVIGYAVGNDMSSRDIEGQNPLYLCQAKAYNRCCALGPSVRLARDFDPVDLSVECVIRRDGKVAFSGQTHTSRIRRPIADLVTYIGRCNSFPSGVFILTGTGVVPPDTFTLAERDVIEITIEGIGTLRNPVIELAVD